MNKIFKVIKDVMKILKKIYFKMLLYLIEIQYFLFLKIRKKFEKELQSLAPTGKTVKVIAPPERKFSAWLGGAILSSMTNFKNTMFVSKKEWMENGQNVIYDKFF